MENMDTDNNVYLITILAIIGDLGDAFDQQAREWGMVFDFRMFKNVLFLFSESFYLACEIVIALLVIITHQFHCVILFCFQYYALRLVLFTNELFVFCCVEVHFTSVCFHPKIL